MALGQPSPAPARWPVGPHLPAGQEHPLPLSGLANPESLPRPAGCPGATSRAVVQGRAGVWGDTEGGLVLAQCVWVCYEVRTGERSGASTACPPGGLCCVIVSL